MPETHNFEHLPLLMREQGRALLSGGGDPTPQTIANRQARAQHTAALTASSGSASHSYKEHLEQRETQERPVLPSGIPLLLQVDPSLELDILRRLFQFEIISEEEEGYVVVASEDLDLTLFNAAVSGFAVQVRGTATVAQVHKLDDDPNHGSRLKRILSDSLFEIWPSIKDNDHYIVDLGIACAGTVEIPNEPTRGKKETDAAWAKKGNNGLSLALLLMTFGIKLRWIGKTTSRISQRLTELRFFM
jgi:hypothetical protein